MDLPDRLKALRMKKEVTQREVGQVLSLSNSTISLYESGERTPDLVTLQRLADYFQVSVDYLLCRTDELRPVATSIYEIRGRRFTQKQLEALVQKQEVVEEILSKIKWEPEGS